MTVPDNINGVIHREMNVIIPSHMNYGKLMIDAMMKSKDEIALIDGMTGEEITFGEMVQLIVNTADSLLCMGVKRDDVVAICSENRIEYLITSIAVWCSGATITYLNCRYSQDNLVHTMNISRPKYVFMSPTTYKTYYKTMVSTKLVASFFVYGNSVNDPTVKNFTELTKNHIDIDSFRPVTDLNGLTQTAVILYSSGTTDLPKGTKLSHLNFMTSNSQFLKSGDIKLKCLMLAPWSHTVGIFLTLERLLNNVTVIFLTRFIEEEYLSCIEKYKPGLLLVVPPVVVMLSQYSKINKYNVGSVRYMFCGGAPLDLAVINEAKEKFPNLIEILQGYGMTEAGCITKETMKENRSGSIGKANVGTIVKVVDVDSGIVLGPNKPGELCMKGPALFNGYIGKNITDFLDTDGFFKTGDICYYDNDGFFYFVDRLKELIKYKSIQVAPSELEGLLLQHPAVKDVGVVGKPDPLAGELPTAFVVKKTGVNVSEDELKDYVAATASSWKKLRGGVYFIDEIPKNPSGKILRRQLRDLLKTKSKL